jgi:predicted dehydrogenase
MSYDALIHIGKEDFSDRRVVVIGAGWMADQYCQALRALGVRSVTVVSRKEESARQCCQKYDFQPRHGGYREAFPALTDSDLVIVATPIHELRPAAEFAVSLGFRNILVEKPGALYSKELADWAASMGGQGARIRLAFNRQAYPSFWKLKELAAAEGGIISCHYMFTEWVHTINFSNNRQEVYQRWGVANSLHVIAMAHALIGLPKTLSAYRSGGLSWHPTGERFYGAGVTEEDILFSYQADWGSAGRWGIEVMTPQSAYRLIPLEKLFRCAKGSVAWDPVEITQAFPGVKEGVAEEVAIMLQGELEKGNPLPDLKEGAAMVEVAERILGY